MSVYLDAIKVLEQRGWCQNAYQDGEGRVCLATAIGRVNGFGGYTWREAVTLNDVVPDFKHIFDFNDDPHTTYEDVVLVLKRAHEASEVAE